MSNSDESKKSNAKISIQRYLSARYYTWEHKVSIIHFRVKDPRQVLLTGPKQLRKAVFKYLGAESHERHTHGIYSP
jgi:hypothetical protein